VEANPARRDLLRNALVVLARKSGDLAIAVVGEFRAGFDARLVPGESAVAGSSALAADALSPVDDVARRLDLALDQCASRLREQTAAEVAQLSARLSEMLGVEALADDDNPVLPRVLARSLLDGIATLGFEGEARLAVFKAYGPALLHIAPDLYSHANSLMAELGVLAVIKVPHGKPINSQPAAAPLPQPVAVVADERGLAAILERLLDGERGSSGKKAKEHATQ
jgi:hypothetical protein